MEFRELDVFVYVFVYQQFNALCQGHCHNKKKFCLGISNDDSVSAPGEYLLVSQTFDKNE